MTRLPDYSALQRIEHYHGKPGWGAPGGGVYQIPEWLPKDDAEWLAEHLELAGFIYSDRWWNGLLF